MFLCVRLILTACQSSVLVPEPFLRQQQEEGRKEKRGKRRQVNTRDSGDCRDPQGQRQRQAPKWDFHFLFCHHPKRPQEEQYEEKEIATTTTRSKFTRNEVAGWSPGYHHCQRREPVPDDSCGRSRASYPQELRDQCLRPGDGDEAQLCPQIPPELSLIHI